jgi:hypothetical protein
MKQSPGEKAGILSYDLLSPDVGITSAIAALAA